MGKDVDVEFFTPNNPYERPGAWREKIEKTFGPMCDAQFMNFAQMLLAMMYAKVFIKGSVSAPGGPIAFNKFTVPLEAFTIGGGGNGATAGLPAAIQGGALSTADTSLANPKQNQTASLAPATNMAFTSFAVQMSLQSIFRVNGSVKAFGAGWLQPYRQTILQALAEELSTTLQFGPSTVAQLLGPPRNYMKVSLQQGDYNSDPGSPVYTQCSFISGAPISTNQMSCEVTLPNSFEIDPLVTSTTQVGDVYVPLLIGLYGTLGCSTGTDGLACPTPTPPDMDRRINKLEDMINKIASKL